MALQPQKGEGSRIQEKNTEFPSPLSYEERGNVY
jgi:hypothetical protein